MNAGDEFRQAVDRGDNVYALVLRGQRLLQVRGRDVRPGELLCWCCPGFTRWRRVAYIKTVPVRWTPPPA